MANSKVMSKKKKISHLLLFLVLLVPLGFLIYYVNSSDNVAPDDSEASSAYTIEIRYTAEGGGRIEGNAVQNVEKWKQTSKVEAVPMEGYYFHSWDDGELSSSRSDTAVQNKTYRARFKKKPNVTNTIKYIAGEGGKIEWFTAGQTGDPTKQDVKFDTWGRTVKAVPNKGYEFRGWSDGSEIAWRKDKAYGRNVTHKAFFQKIGEEKFRVEYKIDPPGYGEFVDRNIDFPVQYLLPGEQGTPVSVKGYDFSEFVMWSDGYNINKYNQGSKDTTRKDVGNGQSQVKVAMFKSKYEKGALVTYSVENKNCGYVEGQTIQYLRKNTLGKYVVARVLNKNCEFVRWSDGKTTEARTDLGDPNGKDKEYKAIFRAKSNPVACTQATVTLRYTVEKPNQGYIEGDRVQVLRNSCEYGRTIKAVPYEGYEFSHWYDNEAKTAYKVNGRYVVSSMMRYTGWGPKYLIAIFKPVQ